MGMGEYLSALSEHQYVLSERQREEWEFQNHPQGEVEEMVELYKEQGFAEDDARAIMTIMAKHQEFFIDHMMVQELGLMPPDEDESPAKNGLVMFLAFISFGLVPLLCKYCSSASILVVT
jgi:DNA damage-binding protein 1